MDSDSREKVSAANSKSLLLYVLKVRADKLRRQILSETLSGPIARKNSLFSMIWEPLDQFCQKMAAKFIRPVLTNIWRVTWFHKLESISIIQESTSSYKKETRLHMWFPPAFYMQTRHRLPRKLSYLEQLHDMYIILPYSVLTWHGQVTDTQCKAATSSTRRHHSK